MAGHPKHPKVTGPFIQALPWPSNWPLEAEPQQSQHPSRARFRAKLPGQRMAAPSDDCASAIGTDRPSGRMCEEWPDHAR